ncbi:MAG: ABC transporter substrate-binding protein [Proteobacteria bacterium]|nr:ABC transporter substrate-binding protein [Pseudomonadota bacterium]
MLKQTGRLALAAVVGAGLVAGAGVASAETIKRGGTLNFVVAGTAPSYDAHVETTYAMIHRIRPFYSLLIRVNPDNPSSPTDFVCDLCEGAVPKGTEGGTKFTFKIRKDVKFHDGTPLTSADIKATYDKIIFPPKGIPSARRSFYLAVESVTTPDPYTIVFKLKFPTGSFIPAMASPFNFVYAKKDLDKNGLTWHKTHVNGTGAFKFVQDVQGAVLEGVKYENYHHVGLDGKPKPYLDGFKAINSAKMAVSIQAIRGDRASIEFRGFPPKARDDLVKALGKDITVQESDWNCVLLGTPNHKRKGMDDPRVRRALTLMLDRWNGSKYLSQIAIVKSVGGVVFPSHPFAATKDELTKIAGFGTDIEKARAEATKLLADAGMPGYKFTLINRGVDQPYKVVGTWMIDQWTKSGLQVDQQVQPTPTFYNTLRKSKDFDIAIDFNCQTVINPIADITKFLGSSGANHGQYENKELDAIYDKILRSGDVAEQRKLIRNFETLALDTQAHELITLWWYKINPHRSYVKGWKTAPSHYLNVHYDNIWLDK